MRYTPRLIDESEQRLLLAVGHIVRCPEFATGLKWRAAPEDPVMVAWSDESYVDYHIKSGKADPANDPTRAQAKFLGDANALETKRQLDRAIKCLEFCETHQVHPDSEVIRMPWPTTHFGGLQVVDVSEDDDPASWTAAMVNGQPVKLQAGDLAIRSSHAFNLPE